MEIGIKAASYEVEASTVIEDWKVKVTFERDQKGDRVGFVIYDQETGGGSFGLLNSENLLEMAQNLQKDVARCLGEEKAREYFPVIGGLIERLSSSEFTIRPFQKDDKPLVIEL